MYKYRCSAPSRRFPRDGFCLAHFTLGIGCIQDFDIDGKEVSEQLLFRFFALNMGMETVMIDGSAIFFHRYAEGTRGSGMNTFQDAGAEDIQ